MVFNSLAYACFLPAVLGVYYALPSWRAQNRFLLAASWLFYGWWDWRFLGLLGLSTLVDFGVARRLHRTTGPSRDRWLGLSLAVNLGVLGVFKYFGFFADSFALLAQSAGWEPGRVTLELVLPVGISFYTFQTLAYTIDVYRGRLEPTDDLVDFALYVSFFPQLVAGPIERAQALLPQLGGPRAVDLALVRSGLLLILIGLVRKVGIADAVAAEVDDVFASPTTHSRVALVGGAYLFALQIYGDFAGYSAIARGSARLLGIELIRNFDQPYLATNITDFWRRWHRSLSLWLRDYVYIPLGGSRHGAWRTYRNLFVTMLVGGLWHGASWTFIAWGALHGAWLALHKLWLGDAHKQPPRWDRPRDRLGNGLKILATFHLVLLAWVLFRVRGFSELWTWVWSLALGPTWLGYEHAALLMIAVYGSASFALDLVQAAGGRHTAMLDWPRRARWAGAVVLVLFLLALGGLDADVPFLYFQF